jgi:hypothetical protein
LITKVKQHQRGPGPRLFRKKGLYPFFSKKLMPSKQFIPAKEENPKKEEGVPTLNGD